MTDRTELRRQIAEAIYIDSGRSFGWPTYAEALSGSPRDLAKYGRRDGVTAKAYAENSESNAAAIMGIIGPRLDQLDAAEAALARVRELHTRESFWQYHRDQEHSYLTQQDAADASGCDCPYAPEPSADLAHTPECLATISHFDVCAECARIEYADADRQMHGDFSGYAEALWPCPTIRARDATPTGGES